MQRLTNGTNVKIDQGFGEFVYGQVISFDSKKRNLCGWKGNYKIKVTGHSDNLTKILKSVIKVGSIRTVLSDNVSKI